MPKRIDNREFVVAWLNSKSLEEVAKNCGMASAASAQAKAHGLRKLGVKLPKFSQTRIDRDLEIAQLNSLIKKHMAAGKSA